MDLNTFRQTLADHPGRSLRFVPEGGQAIADHFHVTEIGRVEKQFVDCGGVRRNQVTCLLQTLVADDTDHRLTTDKLVKIVALTDELGLSGDTPVEVEHQERSVSVDAIESYQESNGVLEFHLSAKQTACLAGDACGLALAPDGTLLKGTGLQGTGLNVISGCDGSTGCC